MIKTIFIIWAVISLITFICELVIAKKFLNDKSFVNKIKAIENKEYIKILTKKSDWVILAVIPLLHIFTAFTGVIFVFWMIYDYKKFRESTYKAIVKMSDKE